MSRLKVVPTLTSLVLWILLSGILSNEVHAQPSVGLRAGVSADPGQFYFGGHIESGPLIRNLRFRPNIEAGFGDRRTVIAINGEFIGRLALDNGYSAYLGGGPAVNVQSFTAPTRGGETEVGPGVNFLVGLRFPQRIFTELKVGAIDSHRVKFSVGYTFP